MNLNVNSVVQLINTWRDTNGSKYQNVFRFRVTAGEAPESIIQIDQSSGAAFKSWITGKYINAHAKSCLPTSVAHWSCSSAIIYPVKGPRYLVPQGGFTGSPNTGTNTALLDGDAPEACVCINRLNYLGGRKGMGRVYWGPVGSADQSHGLYYPTTDITANLPLMMGDWEAHFGPADGAPAGFDLAPTVVGDEQLVNIGGAHDLRTMRTGPRIVFLKSRRVVLD
jgi:hypothetical protein